MSSHRTAVRVGLTVLPILISLIVTSVLIVAVGHNPLDVFQAVWQGAFRNPASLANVINFWVPVTLCSIGLVVTFTAGQWNIGVEGQMALGAIFATWPALFLSNLPSPLLIALELIMAMVGGGLWALLVGVLKMRLRVHEIFGGVALNALASVLTIYLIAGPWQPPRGGSVQGTVPFADTALLQPLSSDFRVNLLMVLICLIAIAAVALALRGTRWGLQLKATGKNARSALLLGVPTERSALSAFVICGMLAGLAGAYRVLFTFSNLRPSISGGIGFLALLIVLVVANRVLLAPLVAFIFAATYVGSTRLKVVFQLDQSLAGVLQDMVVLLVILFQGLRSRGQTQSVDQEAPVPSTSIAPLAPSEVTQHE